MNRDTKLKLGILVATAAIGGALALVQGLRYPWSDGFAPFMVVGVFGPCAIAFHRRKVQPFAISLLAAMQVLVFTACFTVLMYALASFGAPLADESFLAADRWLGFHTPDVVAWANAHPLLHRVIIYAYNSTFLQTLAVILILGFRDERRPLELFVLRFMLALLITAAIFTVLPAKGPFALHGLEANPTQTQFLTQFEALRSGELRNVSLRDAEGLVTFPSFHTTWALLIAFAVFHHKRLFVPFAFWNALVVVGTLTTGWHYLVDVLAGAALAVVVMFVTTRLRPWIERGDVAADSAGDPLAGDHGANDEVAGAEQPCV